MTPGTSPPAMVAATAPQALWPRTMSTLAPSTAVPNSREPMISLLTMLPATRVTNTSPKLRGAQACDKDHMRLRTCPSALVLLSWYC